MKSKLLLELGITIFAFAGLDLVSTRTVLGQSIDTRNRDICASAAYSDFSRMRVSSLGINCRRYGFSDEYSRRIESEGSRGNALIDCMAAKGNWRSDIGVCMPSSEYSCRRQGYVWSSRYNECFPR
jgi:hypothetical protein